MADGERLLKSGAMRVHLRCMIRRDMAEVLAIDKASFEFPWVEEDFLKCLRGRNCSGMIAEFDERVVGLWIYCMHKKHLEIISLAVHADFRRRKVATQIIEKMKGKLAIGRRQKIIVVVRETNLRGQKFFASMKFRAVKCMRRPWLNDDEDGIGFSYRLYDPKSKKPFTPKNRMSFGVF